MPTYWRNLQNPTNYENYNLNNARRIIKNSAFEIATYGVRSVSIILVPVFLARLAGPELLGQYVTVMSLAGVFVFVAGFGLPRLLMREIALVREDKEEVAKLVNASLGVVLLISLITIVLMLTIGTLMSYSTILMRALFLTGIAVAVETMTNVIMASFRGLEEMHWSWLVKVVIEVVFIVLLIGVLSIQARIDWLMAAYLIATIVALFVAIGLYWPRFGRLGLLVDVALWRSLIKMGFPFAVNTAVTAIRGRVGVIILAFFSGNVAVAMLEVATSLTVRINVLGRSVNDATYPFLSSQYVKDARSLNRYTAKSVRFLLIPSALIATVLWVFGEDIVGLLYGKEYLEAVPALKLLALLIPLRFVTYSLGTALTASNRQSQRATSVTLAAIVNVLLGLLLIPRYQMMGAVYAILLTEVMLFGLTIWYLRAEALEMIDWRPFVGPVLGSLIILVISFFLINMLNVWILLILTVLIYFVIIVGVDRSAIEPLRLMVKGWRS